MTPGQRMQAIIYQLVFLPVRILNGIFGYRVIASKGVDMMSCVLITILKIEHYFERETYWVRKWTFLSESGLKKKEKENTKRSVLKYNEIQKSMWPFSFTVGHRCHLLYQNGIGNA